MMENSTTPIKGAVCALIAAKLTALLGLDPVQSTALATSIWFALTAALAYAFPADAGILAALGFNK